MGQKSVLLLEIEILMYPALQETIESLLPAIGQLPAERTQLLNQLAQFVSETHADGRGAQLNFICTHNSRRSHLGQLWAAAAAAHFHVGGVETFSGGTEATAFNPRAVAAIRIAGFQVENPGGQNPRYVVRWDASAPPQVCFSKVFDHPINPTEHFAAVMTCTDADEKCPVVLGATLRVSLPYDDPKVADDTAEEATLYQERSRQIATEMLYIFSKVAAAAKGATDKAATTGRTL